MAAPASPCINVCKLDHREVCLGCGRHINEIIEWTAAGDDRKHAIIAAARERLTHLAGAASAATGLPNDPTNTR